jgi:hypothetical protein
MNTATLPKLLYVGDVPVEPTVAGAALFYRLLQAYPADRLMVVQGEQPGDPPRLPGVRYATFRLPLQKFTRTRLHQWAGVVRYLTAERRVSAIGSLAANFPAEAVLTVVAGYSWITAAAFARKHQLPLHLIIHDEVSGTLALPARMHDSLSRTFADVCRQAVNRFCISPQMAAAYSLPGAPASVLYPSRAANHAAFVSPPEPTAGRRATLRFGYAGSIHSPGYARLLANLAGVIEPMGGKLVLFAGSTPPPSLLALANVESRGFVENSRLLAALRESVDVLFLPMSFDQGDRPNMELSFPSKLTDYTAACLPLLICGPAYCSAIHWGEDHPGVAELVKSESREALEAAVKRLWMDENHRQALALRASEVGESMFAQPRIAAQFLDAIRSSQGRINLASFV